MNGGRQPVELDLAGASAALLDQDLHARLRWAVDQFGEHLAVLASMQKSSSVLLHAFHELGLRHEILFVDTGFHFHETLRLRDEFMRRYGLNIVTLYPHRTPAEQEAHYELKLYNYVDGQPQCCHLRKEQPFLEHVLASGKRLIVSGLRRDEGGARKDVQPLTTDPRIQGFNLHPLFDWTDADLDEYLRRHDVPMHPLHERGYPSIGCQVCTTPVTPGEDPRAGRWRHLRNGDDGPQYCGINYSDGGGI